MLCLDENAEKPLSVNETSAKCQCHPENIYALRKQFVLEGMDRVLYRKKRETSPVPAKVTGEVEAHIIAAACSDVPEGRKAWTLQMIADKIILDKTVESISDETVRRVLKKEIFTALSTNVVHTTRTKCIICCRNGRRFGRLYYAI